MLYHYVLTVQAKRRRWGRRCVHTVSGHAEVNGQLIEKVVFERVFYEIVKTNRLDPHHTATLFYRLAPEMASLEIEASLS